MRAKAFRRKTTRPGTPPGTLAPRDGALPSIVRVMAYDKDELVEMQVGNAAEIRPLLKDWRARGAIPRKAKFAALAGMIFGFTIFQVAGRPGLPLTLAVAALMLTGLVYVFSRPS